MIFCNRLGIYLAIVPELNPRRENAANDGCGGCEFQKELDDFRPTRSKQLCCHVTLPKSGGYDSRMLNFEGCDYRRSKPWRAENSGGRFSRVNRVVPMGRQSLPVYPD